METSRWALNLLRNISGICPAEVVISSRLILTIGAAGIMGILVLRFKPYILSVILTPGDTCGSRFYQWYGIPAD